MLFSFGSWDHFNFGFVLKFFLNIPQILKNE